MEIFKINRNIALNIFSFMGYLELFVSIFLIIFMEHTLKISLSRLIHTMCIVFFILWLLIFIVEYIFKRSINIQFNEEYKNSISTKIYFYIGILSNLYLTLFDRILPVLWEKILLFFDHYMNFEEEPYKLVYVLIVYLILLFSMRINPFRVTHSFTLNLFVLYGYVHAPLLIYFVSLYADGGIYTGAFLIEWSYYIICVLLGIIFIVLNLIEKHIFHNNCFKINKEYTEKKKWAQVYYWIGLAGNLVWGIPCSIVILCLAIIVVFYFITMLFGEG